MGLSHFRLYNAGQRQDSNGETIIIYTLLGKRDLYEITIKELIENNDLLEQFHPFQAVKFGSIAIGDLLFSLPPEQREHKYNHIRKQMLESNDLDDDRPEPATD
ncbi:MAG: hypothetical protein GY821_04245 [Gammaproteobacteria bacterium]|nr:hypothetical protein [Gammaproteobacteria bacterium]